MNGFLRGAAQLFTVALAATALGAPSGAALGASPGAAGQGSALREFF